MATYSVQNGFSGASCSKPAHVLIKGSKKRHRDNTRQSHFKNNENWLKRDLFSLHHSSLFHFTLYLGMFTTQCLANFVCPFKMRCHQITEQMIHLTIKLVFLRIYSIY
jgi:hypothetical protein